jgi:hypothetical protein
MNFFKSGKAINSEIYCRQLYAFHQKLLKKQPDLVNCKIKLLLHDNAPFNVAKQQKLKELGYEI